MLTLPIHLRKMHHTAKKLSEPLYCIVYPAKFRCSLNMNYIKTHHDRENQWIEAIWPEKYMYISHINIMSSSTYGTNNGA